MFGQTVACVRRDLRAMMTGRVAREDDEIPLLQAASRPANEQPQSSSPRGNGGEEHVEKPPTEEDDLEAGTRSKSMLQSLLPP